MDNQTFQVAAPAPQTITITLDPVLRAALADLTNMVGALVNETREVRRLTAEMKAGNDILIASNIAANQARADSDRMAAAFMSVSAPTDAMQAPTSDASGDEGVEALNAHGVDTAPEIAPKSAQEILDDVYDGIEDTWFVGQDKRYYVHAEGGDRRATAQEKRAIDSQTARSRSRKRR